MAPRLPTAYDLTSPEVLKARLIEVLGDRYVDLSLEENESYYAVWVLNLKDAEKAGILAELASEAPIELRSADVSRTAVDELESAFKKSSPDGRMGINFFGKTYSTGSLVIGYSSATTAMELANSLSSELGSTPIVDQHGNHLAGTAPEPSEAVVMLEHSVFKEQEGALEEPYRAGKYVSIGSFGYNCTTGFLFTRNDKRFGSSAGHCGRGGDTVFFAGDQKGDFGINILYDGQGTKENPAPGDAGFYDLGNGGTATVFIDSDSVLDVVGRVPTSDLEDGFRVCTYGAVSDNTPPTCGEIIEPLDRTIYSARAHRWAGNAYCWEFDPGGPSDGDSGAPVVRLLGGGDGRAAGLHRVRSAVEDYACFTAIGAVLSNSNMSLITR